MPSISSTQIENSPLSNTTFFGLYYNPTILEQLPYLLPLSVFGVTSGNFLNLLSSNYKSNNITYITSNTTIDNTHDGKLLIVTNANDTTISFTSLYSAFNATIIKLDKNVFFANDFSVTLKNANNQISQISNNYTSMKILYTDSNTCLIVDKLTRPPH